MNIKVFIILLYYQNYMGSHISKESSSNIYHKYKMCLRYFIFRHNQT